MHNEPIHPWRWRMLALWCIIFTGLVFWAIRSNRQNINELNTNKASIISLQRTNCALRDFLGQAESTRLKAAKAAVTPAERKADLSAARGYEKLVRIFPHDGCKRALRGH